MRVLIGSTFKLGIGANVQTKLKAIHHLDIPWRPADMIQREGRILRRGNEHQQVLIFRYIAQGSFDAYSWQVLQNKQHFISQFLSGAGTVRTMADLDNDELNYAQVKAMALSSPLMKEYTEAENRLHQLQIVYRQEEEQRANAKQELETQSQQLAALRARRTHAGADAVYVAQHLALLKDSCDDALDDLKQSGDTAPLGEFTLTLHTGGKKSTITLQRENAEYTIDLGKSQLGTRRRLHNFLEKFNRMPDSLQQQIDDVTACMDNLRRQMNYQSDTAAKISEMQEKVNTLFTQISVVEET